MKKSSKNIQKCQETVKKPTKIRQKYKKPVKKQYTYPKTINNIGKPQKKLTKTWKNCLKIDKNVQKLKK